MGILEGKTALITGGGRGIGRELASGFVREGAQVAIVDIAVGSPHPDSWLAIPADVTDFADVTEAVETVVAAFGRIDILVNNAGFYGGMTRAPFEQLSESEWDRMMAVNVKGVWNVTRAVAPHMTRAGYGKIVNVSSATIFIGQPNMLHYVASKGAVFAMTRSLSRELGPRGIRVNSIAPGLTLSEASIESFQGREETPQRVAAATALGITLQPRDLVGTVAFLASPLSDAMTGQIVNVDGGLAHW
jgi:3-oxoacyl-[acyl-carrier protein] reductase